MTPVVKNIAVVLQAVQAAADRADPQAAFVVLDQGADGIVAQAVQLPQVGDGSALQAIQAAAVAADPQGAVAVLINDADLVPGQPLAPRKGAQNSPLEADQAAAGRADPHRPVPGRAEGPHGIARLAAGQRLGKETPGRNLKRPVLVPIHRVPPLSDAEGGNIILPGPGRGGKAGNGALRDSGSAPGWFRSTGCRPHPGREKDEVAAKPVFHRVIAEFAAPAAKQPVGGADPQCPVRAFGHDQHAVVLHLRRIGFVKNGEVQPVKAGQPFVGPDPQVAVPGFGPCSA